MDINVLWKWFEKYELFGCGAFVEEWLQNVVRKPWGVVQDEYMSKKSLEKLLFQ